MIARGWVSPAFGRYLEAFIIGLAASFVYGGAVAAYDMAQGGTFDFRMDTVLQAALTAAGLYVSKAYRDALALAKDEAAKAIQDAKDLTDEGNPVK
jgi:hypothetical protein